MQQQLQEKELHVSGLSFLGKRWLSRDTVHWQAGKRWKGTDWSLSLPTQELGSSVMVLRAGRKQKEAIYHVVASAPVERFAKGGHRWKSLCESQVRQCKYLKEIQTDKPHQVQKIPWAENRQDTRKVSGHHIYLLYSFPSVVVSKHEIPVRQTLGLNT